MLPLTIFWALFLLIKLHFSKPHRFPYSHPSEPSLIPKTPFFLAFFPDLEKPRLGPHSAFGSPALTTVLWPPVGTQGHLFSLWFFPGCQMLLETSACIICLQQRSQSSQVQASKLSLKSGNFSLMPRYPLVHFLAPTTNL